MLEIFVQLAWRPVRLRVHPELRELLRPLLHLELPAQAPELDIEIHLDPSSSQSETAFYPTAEGATHILPHSRAVYHKQENRIVAHYQTPERLSLYELGRPLHALLALWHSHVGAPLIHAGAVIVDGRGFLLGGRAGSGKSTAALACLGAGSISYDAPRSATRHAPDVCAMDATARDLSATRHAPDICATVEATAGGRSATQAQDGFVSDDMTALQGLRGHGLFATSFVRQAPTGSANALSATGISGPAGFEHGLPRYPGEEKTLCYLQYVQIGLDIHAIVFPSATGPTEPISPSQALLELAPSSLLVGQLTAGQLALDELARLVRAVPSFRVAWQPDMTAALRALDVPPRREGRNSAPPS